MPLYRVVLSDPAASAVPSRQRGWGREFDAANEFDAVKLAHDAYRAEMGTAGSRCVGSVTMLCREPRVSV